MSSLRTIAWLLAGIAAIIGVHFAMDVGIHSTPRALRRNVLVPSAERDVAFSIARLNEPVTQLRMGADGTWKVVAPFLATADRRQVLRLADALSFAPVSDEMTDSELLRLGRTRKDFGLEKPSLVVTVGNSGRDDAIVSFGSVTPAGDGVYATVGLLNSVYVVPSNVYAAVNLSASDFRCRSVFSTRPEDVLSFDVKTGVGRFIRVVREGEAWKIVKPVESVASTSRVRAFLDMITRQEAREFVWSAGVSNETAVASASLLAGYGLDSESSVTLSLKCRDGQDYMTSFGRESGEGAVYALIQGGGAIVTVPMSVKDAVVAGAFVDTRLFPFEESAVSALSFDDGTTYLLSRNAGGEWRLDAPVSAVADPKAVKTLVSRILALKSSDVVADGVRVAVGTNVAAVVVSRKAVFADMRPEDLRAKGIISIDPKLLKRLVVTDKAQKPVSVLQDAEKGAWRVESAETAVSADGAAIASLCSALKALEAVRIERLKVSVSELGAFGLDRPLRTIAIDQTAEGTVRRNILIGDVADGGRYVTFGSSDAVFVISSESAATLLAPIVK